jgi:cupin 2 domain-containing protein
MMASETASQTCMGNLFLHPAGPLEEELVDIVARGSALRIERIVSMGQVTPPGHWYDQEQDEWVCLVQGHAEVSFEQGLKRVLHPGDWLLIPARQRHRVERTSSEPPCIWLAVHGSMG